MKSLQNYEQFKQVKQNPLNNSRSKQLYSFSKSPRFNYKEKRDNSPSFYTIKTDLISPHKGVSFGSGSKVDFSKLGTKTPGPGHYQIKQSKTTQESNLKKHTMGVGRIQTKQKSEVPPVGLYQVTQSLVQVNKAPHFGLKLLPKNETCAPGPGKYDIQVKEHSKSFVAGFGSGRSGQTIEDTPGPLEYRPRTEMSPKYANSNWSNCQVTKFSKVQRFGSNATITPGPGKYQIAGEFGIY
ncbi:unnamed protein product (macronuclear) [Paramecium tetraurelia]|uniref:Uncharacterized protein n=1 Tax=Paramecium tetraurelia TaxID=5888 RepID=A0BT71_PARTE|nr:uncharacterized protein GSPATT00031970001 [Paramecium tetraurelia]CAK61738.1 unnamed protein product [Paramecium tetraurelia]|eukprot:XP_001429136.1 hypothetical protein (macronuclear) [Paramecium tetraurelia strain d4-2]